jgi:hypothetical protein
MSGKKRPRLVAGAGFEEVLRDRRPINRAPPRAC